MPRRRAKPLGEVTRQDFQAIAAILCDHAASEVLADSLARYFKNQNPRFDRSRFVRATRACRR